MPGWSCGATVAISLSIALVPASSFSDERCRQLEALNAKYAGVKLTPEQKDLKVKLVAWYNENCRGHHAPSVQAATSKLPNR